MMTKIKICGITCRDDALAASDAGTDVLGFVLAPEARKRNRYITPDAAADIIACLPAFVLTVGVVVNESLEVMRGYLQLFDRLQLHGDESAEMCEALMGRAYKAFQTGPGCTLDVILRFPGNTVLLDAWAPDARGGTGQVCDWKLAACVAAKKKLILAGGLSPENVEEAVRRVRPYAVDASGSLEAAPGKKDHERIRKFINNARKASLA